MKRREVGIGFVISSLATREIVVFCGQQQVSKGRCGLCREVRIVFIASTCRLFSPKLVHITQAMSSQSHFGRLRGANEMGLLPMSEVRDLGQH